jgi:hypothetical protein
MEILNLCHRADVGTEGKALQTGSGAALGRPVGPGWGMSIDETRIKHYAPGPSATAGYLAKCVPTRTGGSKGYQAG